MPSGLSYLPPVSVVPSIRPVTSILPAGQQAAASPFLAPAIAQQKPIKVGLVSPPSGFPLFAFQMDG